MKSVDLKTSTYTDFNKENNKGDPILEVGDYVRIVKYQNIFKKFTLQIRLRKFLWLKKVKYAVPWTYITSDLKGEEIVWTSCKEELQKTNQKELRVKNVLKRKGYKPYVKWKGDDNSFNSWIDKKHSINE